MSRPAQGSHALPGVREASIKRGLYKAPRDFEGFMKYQGKGLCKSPGGFMSYPSKGFAKHLSKGLHEAPRGFMTHQAGRFVKSIGKGLHEEPKQWALRSP